MGLGVDGRSRLAARTAHGWDYGGLIGRTTTHSVIQPA